PLVSIAPTNLPLTTYRHLVLTPGSGRTITLPNSDEYLYGNMTVQGADATAIVLVNNSSSKTLTVAGNLLISSGALQLQNGTAQTIEVGGNLTVGANGTLGVASGGAVATNQLILNGNLVNDGVFDMVNNSKISNVTFTGSANTTLTGTGA